MRFNPVFAAVLVIATCLASAHAEDSGPYPQLTLQLSSDYEWIEVTVNNLTPTQQPMRLPALATVTPAETCQARPRPSAGRSITMAPGACLHYRVALRQLTSGSGWRAIAKVDRRNRIWQLPASDWLPTMTLPIQLTIQVPESFAVSTPWRRLNQDGGTSYYLLQGSPATAKARLILGEFEHAWLEFGETLVDVALLTPQADRGKLLAWLSANIDQVRQTVGEFPTPHLQVILVPASSGRSGSPVPFGHVIRSGNQTIEFFVASQRDLDDFMADWTAAHELSHLLLPYVGDDGRWVSEGFASYYQNVLMAHLGEYSEQTAWEKLLAGFGRARAENSAIAPKHASMRNSRMMTYWSGAAVALMADVQIRSLTQQKQSLNSVLLDLYRCCLPARSSWTVEDLFAELDGFLPEPVFMPLLRQYGSTPGFPSTEKTLNFLGVKSTSSGSVTFAETPGAPIRRSIMALREPIQWQETPH